MEPEEQQIADLEGQVSSLQQQLSSVMSQLAVAEGQIDLHKSLSKSAEEAKAIAEEALIAEQQDKAKKEVDLTAALSDKATLQETVEQKEREIYLLNNPELYLNRDQMIETLDHFGLLDAVNAYFASLADDADMGNGVTGKDAKKEWGRVQAFYPDSALLQAVATSPDFNLTQQDINNMLQWGMANA